MELTGRLTANAIVSTLKEDRQVVNFILAINDYYKPKGSSAGKQCTLFIKCSYWRGTAVAQRLLKGTVVEISGRLFTTAYISTDGEAKASLNAHCNNIKVHGRAKREVASDTTGNQEETRTNLAAITAVEDDIPF